MKNAFTKDLKFLYLFLSPTNKIKGSFKIYHQLFYNL